MSYVKREGIQLQHYDSLGPHKQLCKNYNIVYYIDINTCVIWTIYFKIWLLILKKSYRSGMIAVPTSNYGSLGAGTMSEISKKGAGTII